MQRYIRKLIFVLIILSVCIIVWDYFWVIEVFAQTWTSETTISEKEIAFAANLQLVIRMVYLLMWPLVAIVWATLDNSMVLWEVFYLNVSIYRMRQIMRNFANFALWWIFLFAILRNVFVAMSWNDDSYINGERWIKKLLPKMLLWAVLIQSSFFMMSTLIDLSTVAIYSVGTLPFNVTMSDQLNGKVKWWLENVRFLKPNIKYNLDNSKAPDGTDATFSIFYSCPWNEDRTYYIACKFQNNSTIPRGTNWDDPGTWLAHKDARAEERANLTGMPTADVLAKIDDDFCVYENSLIENPKEVEKVDVCKIAKRRQDAEKAEGEGVMAAQWCPTLASFMTNAAGMTWPMYGLYASILRMDQIALTPNHKDVIEISLEFLIKLFTSVALIIPLLALAVAMMVRLVALWWFIIFSPLLILGWIFFKWQTDWIKDGKASFSSLMWLIFMPVLVVFAISISLVFITLLARSNEINVANIEGNSYSVPDASIWSKLWVQYEPWATCDPVTWLMKCPDEKNNPNCGNINNHCYDLAWITTLCFSDSQTSIGNTILNIMSYLLVNFFWIALMWMVVFAALKSSKITWWITDQIKNLGQDFAKSIPLVPIAWGLSYNDIKNTKDEILSTPSRMANTQNRNFWEYLDRLNAKRWVKKEGADIEIDKALGSDNAQQQAKTFFSNKDWWIADNTSIKDYNKGMKLLGAGAGINNANSLTDIVKTDAWYELLRNMWDWDVSKSLQKLNKINGAQEQAEINADLQRDIKTWLAEAAAQWGSKIRAITKDKFYHMDHKEVVTITDDGKMNTFKVWTIKDALNNWTIDTTKINSLYTELDASPNSTEVLWSSKLLQDLQGLRTATWTHYIVSQSWAPTEFTWDIDLWRVSTTDVLVTFDAAHNQITSIKQGTKGST